MNYNKQYYQNNSEHLRQKGLENYYKNIDKIKQRREQRFLCECGIHYSYNNKLRHFKTKRHINSINKLRGEGVE